MENGFIQDCGEEQARMLIQRELEVVDERHPGYLRTFHQKMWNGQVHGLPMSPIHWNGTLVACFYGWLNNTTNKEYGWEKKNQVAIILGYGPDRNTDIERLIIGVTGGKTPDTSEALHLLNELIEPFLELPGEQAIEV